MDRQGECSQVDPSEAQLSPDTRLGSVDPLAPQPLVQGQRVTPTELLSGRLGKHWEEHSILVEQPRTLFDECFDPRPAYQPWSAGQVVKLVFNKIRRGAKGIVNGFRFAALADTCAGPNIISATYAAKLGLSMRPNSQIFRLGNSKEATWTGKTHIQIVSVLLTFLIRDGHCAVGICGPTQRNFRPPLLCPP